VLKALFLAFLVFTFPVFAEKPRAGHSHYGEALDSGPRQKPWPIAGIGDTPFPITHKNPEVQKWFNQGNALLHSFWYYEAERAFRWCLKLEPDNAMAWWGLSRAAQGDRGREFLREAMKRKAGVTERERLYIESSEEDTTLNPDDPGYWEKTGKKQRQVLERLAMKYPDDVEARALLALNNLAEDRYGTELMVRQVLAKNPDHPGAHHYRIHNWDGKDPEFALESCRRYGSIAPAIGHAHHMPGHIYSGVGMWHEAAIAMDGATRVEKQYMRERMTLPYNNWNYAHNKNYLAYIQGQLGMYEAAISAGRQLLAAPLDPLENKADGFSPHYQGRLVMNRTLVRFERWKEILDGKAFFWNDKLLRDKEERAYLEALAHLGLADLDKARVSIAKHKALQAEIEKEKFAKPRWELMQAELKAKLLLAEGQTLAGLTALGTAAAKFHEIFEGQNDPPFYPSSLYVDLGRAYLKANSPALAVKAFDRSLELIRNDGWALAGLAEAWLALGDKAKATGYYSRVLHVWSDADPGFAPLAKAKALGLVAQPKDESPAPQRSYAKTTLESLGPNRWEPYAAPVLDALDPKNKRVDLAEYKGRNVLLIFYLGQECPHCLEQLQDAAKRNPDFEKHNTAVLAISSNSPEDNADSLKLKQVPFRVLSDRGFANARRFLSYDDFEEIELHSTILIDAKGRVHWARHGGDPFTDFDFLLKEIQRINAQAD
jgi:peroxiredoxin